MQIGNSEMLVVKVGVNWERQGGGYQIYIIFHFGAAYR